MSNTQAKTELYGKYTPAQRDVILSRNQSLLVSASAGTGKTTVMIERIASLIAEGLDVSQMVVVTFTNLAAAEMKNRLAQKLGEYAQNDLRIREQLERLDNSAICTLHSFCCDLLRNYFYVVDLDPSFTILDTVTVNALKKTALDNLFREYFQNDDQDFKKLYRIFATHRKEDNFKAIIYDLHNFSRCIVDFGEWYRQNRAKLEMPVENNPIVNVLLQDISQRVTYVAKSYEDLRNRAKEEKNMEVVADIFERCHSAVSAIKLDNLQDAIFSLCKVTLEKLPQRRAKVLKEADQTILEQLRQDNKTLADDLEKLQKSYATLSRGLTVCQLWQEMKETLQFTDKLVEMVERFDKEFYALKKQRGGVDFNDLEHKTLQLLDDEETLQSVRQQYKMVFVDEYQDTNFVQEAIISKLAGDNSTFMVGDVKQSIYGFRGCEPNIFVDKQRLFKKSKRGKLVELNTNFRSNKHILWFVNSVFSVIMTEKFGKVDYSNNAWLLGETPPTLQTVSVKVDLIVKPEKEKADLVGLYDVTKPTDRDDGVTQGALIANRIKKYVGMAYKDKLGVVRRIEYGDIVILMRGLTTKAMDIYNTLVEKNIPVSASFKVSGLATKEVREIVNLLRVLDNPYNDVYLVGVCLSCMGGFCENDLAQIRLKTVGRIPFFDRLCQYQKMFSDEISIKIDTLLQLLDSLRFYSRGANVCEVVLKILQLTDFALYVQGLPNGGLRLRKLQAFIDGLKDASYTQSIDKFLDYVDETEEDKAEESTAGSNAVRLMTMHASKGLEFPVVILAGLETPFKFDDRAVDRNADLGLITKYYDFAHMKKYATLATTACAVVNRAKQREEEMRLLYVAMTRAKFVLNVVGTVTQKQLNGIAKLPSASNCHIDWLLTSLKKSNSSFDTDAHHLAVEVVQDVTDEKNTSVDVLCEQYTDKNQVLQQINYLYPHKAQEKMPSKIVSSALDKIYLGDENLAPTPVLVQDDRNKVGTAYHCVYQFVDYDADVKQIENTIVGLVNEGLMESQYAERLDVDLIYQTLQNPRLRQIMSQGKVYHEIPFMLYAPYDQLAKDQSFSDKVMLQGVIDMLVIGDNKAYVVDFKYTSRSDKVAERYPYQLNSYKMAVQQVCGIQDVDCYVLSIADNKLIKM